MPFEYDDTGALVTETPEGGDKPLPVWVDNQGQRKPYDPLVPLTQLNKVRTERKTLDEKIKGLEAKLAGFDGIEDPTATLEELEALRAKANAMSSKNGGDDEDSTARLDELETKRAELERQLKKATADLESAQGDLGKSQEAIRSLSVGAAFKSSPWVNPYRDKDGHQRSAKTRLEAEAAMAIFGAHFKPGENGHGVVGTWEPGGDSLIYSEDDPSKVADFDEAFSLLFNRWPQRAHYLPSGEPGGMGARESGGAGPTGGTMTRSRFDKLQPAAKTDFMKKGGKVVE